MAMKKHLEAMGRLRAIGEAIGSDEKELKGDGDAL